MAAIKCPSCGTSVEWQGNAFRPFCSERCRLIDLGAWLGERYAVPGEPVASEGDEPGSDPGPPAPGKARS
jgi:uncharacterized protein